MKNKEMKLSDIILPSKKTNFFVVTVLVLGLISGSIFLITLNNADKAKTILQIENFFTNINKNNINNGNSLKNSLIINYTFIGVIWILGLTIIGVLFNIFLTYIRGFIIGFSISSIITTYKLKGLLAALLYIFPSQVFNVIIIIVLTIYSIMFSNNLLKVVTSKKNNNKLMLKKYTTILIFCIILSFISTLSEVYLFPKLLKIIISLYIK